jgi:hypothetical protein
MRNVVDKSCRENQDTQFIFSKSSENCAVYEITWKNMTQAVDDNTAHALYMLDS